MDKLILEFDEAFWDQTVDWFNYVAERPGDWAQTLNISKYLKKPILMMFNSDPNTISFEDLTDEEVLESGMKVIKLMFPEAPDRPTSYIRTNWCKDQFAKGCFTYIATGSSFDDCHNLAEKIDNKLWLAGEYIYPTFIGTVNSAYISGENAAKEIVKIYN